MLSSFFENADEISRNQNFNNIRDVNYAIFKGRDLD